jgi:NAD(P)-dependent dehydrogenase (short-subunit alcohol dehydrogenase family)
LHEPSLGLLFNPALTAPLFLTQALLTRLHRGAKVALVSSRMGSIGDNGSSGYYGYRMSKAALNAAGMSLAHDLRALGIAVVTLHPGAVRTGMTGGQGATDADESAAGLLRRIDELAIETTGRFLHADGTVLPWRGQTRTRKPAEAANMRQRLSGPRTSCAPGALRHSPDRRRPGLRRSSMGRCDRQARSSIGRTGAPDPRRAFDGP